MEKYKVDLKQRNEEETIDWEMDEFLHHKHSLIWYLALLLVASALSIASYWIVQDIVAPISILVMAFVIGLFSFKKPKRLKYSLTAWGLKVGSRLYEYHNFKTFSLIQDNGIAALYLVTNQRFTPPLTLYLPLDKDKLIVNTLSRYVAYAPGGLQWIERFMQYLRL